MASAIDRQVIAAKVREARTAAGLSQAALAEAAHLSNETISRIERGAYDASLTSMVALADALGVSVDFLLGRSERDDANIPSSPVVVRLTQRAQQLTVAAQRALLKIAELLPEKKSTRRKT